MTRVFIYGSCVTRDSEPWFKDFGFEMVGYVARQSLISAFRKADIKEFDFTKVTSKFQRLMTTGDIRGNLRFAIRETNPDVIFWDLCDERLGVRSAPGGGMITQSRNYIAEGLHKGPLGRLHRLGDEQHFKLWQRGLEEFLRSLDHQGLRDRLYLNYTPWAEEDEFGNKDAGSVESAVEFNSKAERYIDHAWAKGVKISVVPKVDAISRSKGHRWGPAPFHYIDGTYFRMLEALKETMDQE